MTEIAAAPAAPLDRRWVHAEVAPLSPRSLVQLVANEIPAIVVPAFASEAECAALVAHANELGFERYRGVSPPIDRLGVTVFEHDGLDAAGYFRAAAAAHALQREIFACSFDPLARFIALVAANHRGRVSVAVDPQRGAYFAGLIRRIEHGTLLHIDDAAVEHPRCHVAQARAQLSWNLYLQLEGDRGALTVHDRAWQPAHEPLRTGSYGYHHDVVDGAPRFTYHPAVGEVCIFNTRNFHEVAPSGGTRIAFTSAIGTFADDAIELWS